MSEDKIQDQNTTNKEDTYEKVCMLIFNIRTIGNVRVPWRNIIVTVSIPTHCIIKILYTILLVKENMIVSKIAIKTNNKFL